MKKKIEIYDGHLPVIDTEGEDLQRTEEWFNARKGRFTGSGIKDLMSCDRSASKMEWGRAEKLISFGDAAKKYIYSKFKERQRNKIVRTATSSAMRYGTENEGSILHLLKEQFQKYTFEEVGFIEFIDGVAGSSPDGRVITDTGEVLGLEIKAATDWSGVYDRHVLPVDQKNKDFWQLQSEMLSLDVSRIMYVTAEPSESIFEPNITDLSIRYVDASPIHQDAIKKRCLIADEIIKKHMLGVDYFTAIQQVCTDYEF